MVNTLIIKCPKCGHINQASAMNCDICHINLTWALANQASWEVKGKPEQADLHALLAQQQDETYVVGGMQSLTAAMTPTEDVAAVHTAMLKQIRSWGIWSLALGVVHILASGFFSAPWGILLLIVGWASFFFHSASMFIIYTVILTWVALTNALSGLSGWMFFAVLQLYWAWRVLQQFWRFRQVEAELIKSAADQSFANALTLKRSEQFFPWIGSVLSCSSILGILLLFVVVIIFGSAGTTFIRYWAFAVDLTINLGVLGFALVLASLLSGYRLKILAIIGLVAGFLIMILDLIFLVAMKAA